MELFENDANQSKRKKFARFYIVTHCTLSFLYNTAVQ
jgi:hypothetical protein